MYGYMISYVYEYGCISTCVYVLYMCGIMWDYKCGYNGVMWCYDISVWYIHAWYDLVLWVCYDLRIDVNVCYICGFWACCMTGILYVVLNTMCSCIWCYVMWFGIYKVWLLWLYNAVMCVYVDNYVDNSLIYVYNFLLQMQHFYELFWKYYIFVYFRTLSLIISCLLFLSLFFIILL